MHASDFLFDFMDRYNYPEIAKTEFTRVMRRLDDEKAFGDEVDEAVNTYMNNDDAELNDALAKMTAIAEKYNENEYTMHFIFLLNIMPILKQRYLDNGYSEELFYDGADDLRCKLLECIKCKGVPGTFVASWNHGFLKMQRFALGRFQYEHRTYDEDFDFTTSCGKVLKDGDLMINFHIPSSGISLTDDVRLASYKKAYNFYKDLFPDGKVVFCVHSWLLFPKNSEILPPTSNIIRFLNDFEIVSWEEKDEFGDAWRIFGADADKAPEDLPRNTSLERSFADWLIAGKKTGAALGVFVFDGEKIVR